MQAEEGSQVSRYLAEDDTEMMTSRWRATPLPVPPPAPGGKSGGASYCWKQRRAGGHLLPTMMGSVERSTTFCATLHQPA